MKAKTILITGGSGFIGSALVRHLVKNTQHRVINIDKLTYSGSELNLPGCIESGRYHFIRSDICEQKNLRETFQEFKPEVVMHLAAESHVDRSIVGPEVFVESNIKGTFALLEESRAYWSQLSEPLKSSFRFLHVSTDEVFGTLGDEGYFTESTPYAPNSPYSASKAASDHLARAWYHTYGLPVLVTNCSNNYGPYQFPEKLIPLVITKALKRESLPIYGKGVNVRDWLFVDDHARALLEVVGKGRIGETYNVGCKNERKNIEVVESICAILDDLIPQPGFRYSSLIKFVADRAGHDLRYAIDPTKIQNEIGWRPLRTFEEGLKETVAWYIENTKWVSEILAEAKSK